MKVNLYSIYDTVAQVFNKPFTAHNDADAISSFVEASNNNANAHKDDYCLYAVGDWDDNNGTITPQKAPTKIYSGLDIKTDDTVTKLKTAGM